MEDIYTKEQCLLEVRKLNDIHQKWGNVLVPSLPGQAQTLCLQRLFYFLHRLKVDFGISTEEQLENEISQLDSPK